MNVNKSRNKNDMFCSFTDEEEIEEKGVVVLPTNTKNTV